MAVWSCAGTGSSQEVKMRWSLDELKTKEPNPSQPTYIFGTLDMTDDGYKYGRPMQEQNPGCITVLTSGRKGAGVAPRCQTKVTKRQIIGSGKG